MARQRDATPKSARPRKTNALLPKGYEELLGQLKERIRSAQLRAGLAVNRELIELYWQIGRSIVERQRSDGWGKSIVERLAQDIQSEFPGMTGFSPRNVWRMRAFYLAYTQEVRKLPRPVAELDGENLPQTTCSATPMTSPPSALSSARRRTKLWPNTRSATWPSRSVSRLTSRSWSSRCLRPCAGAYRPRRHWKPSCARMTRPRNKGREKRKGHAKRNRSFVIWPEADGQVTAFFRWLAHTRAEKLAPSLFPLPRDEKLVIDAGQGVFYQGVILRGAEKDTDRRIVVRGHHVASIPAYIGV
jgi:hypothetical protein